MCLCKHYLEYFKNEFVWCTLMHTFFILFAVCCFFFLFFDSTPHNQYKIVWSKLKCVAVCSPKKKIMKLNEQQRKHKIAVKPWRLCIIVHFGHSVSIKFICDFVWFSIMFRFVCGYKHMRCSLFTALFFMGCQFKFFFFLSLSLALFWFSRYALCFD